MKTIVISLIKFYQKFSRFTPSNCRFYPSCSSYALLQFQHNSLFRALSNSIYRILRCNPISDGGLDDPIIYKKIEKNLISTPNVDIKTIKYLLIEVKKHRYYVKIMHYNKDDTTKDK